MDQFNATLVPQEENVPEGETHAGEQNRDVSRERLGA